MGDTAMCALDSPSMKDLSQLLGVPLTDSVQLSDPLGTAAENQLTQDCILSSGSTQPTIPQ